MGRYRSAPHRGALRLAARRGVDRFEDNAAADPTGSHLFSFKAQLFGQPYRLIAPVCKQLCRGAHVECL